MRRPGDCPDATRSWKRSTTQGARDISTRGGSGSKYERGKNAPNNMKAGM